MPPRTIFGACSRCVFLSFKRAERGMDRLTGRAGPIFVGLAVVLILVCAVTFFDVVYPHRFLAPTTSYPVFILGTLWCVYIVYMFTYHYYKAITVRPGSPLDPPHTKAAPRLERTWIELLPAALCIGPLGNPKKEDKGRARAVREVNEARARAGNALGGAGGKQGWSGPAARDVLEGGRRVCKKCVEGPDGCPPKPERTHHCSVCRRCALKFDHHCPWINQCVGLHNERYFLLFLCYFSVGCVCVAWWGWRPLLETLNFADEWDHLTPRTFTLMLWILTLVMAFAVGVMAMFQIWLIMLGESAVESHDNDYYRKTAARRGEVFRNPYDLGRRRNLAYFFNIGPGRYHWSTIFLPLEIPPASDGWTWEKAKGWEDFVMARDDELTDEEEMSEGET